MERGVFVTLKAGWLQWKLAPVTSNTSFLLSIGYGVAFWDIDAQKIDSITVLLLPHYFISFLFLAHITLTWQDSDVCPMFARHSLKFDSTFGCLPGYFEDLATKAESLRRWSILHVQTEHKGHSLLHFLSALYGYTWLKKNVHLWDSRQKYRISWNIHMFCRRTPWDRITLSPNSLAVGLMTTFVM